MNARELAKVVATILSERHSEAAAVALVFASKTPADLGTGPNAPCLLQIRSSDGDDISRPFALILADRDLHGSPSKTSAPSAGATDAGGCIRLVAAPDSHAESLLHLVAQLPDDSAAIVAGVGHVRFAEAADIAYPTSSFLQLAEDNWVPHLASLVERLRNIEIQPKPGLVVDVQHAAPRRPSLMQLLNATPAIVHSTVGKKNSGRTIDDIASDWREWDLARLLGKASHSIDRLMELDAHGRTVLKAQLFLNRGITAQAVQQIEEMGNFDTAEPD